MNEKSQTEATVENEPLKLTIAIRTNGINTIVIPAVDIAYIRLLILDEDEKSLVDSPYKILDEDQTMIFEGKTNTEGFIDHDDVPIKDFSLVIGGYVSAIPAVAHEDERCSVFLPELGYIRLTIFDSAESPLANAPYDIEAEGVQLFSGETDGEGRISHDLVPLQDYDLLIGPEPKKVPAVNYEDELVSVFLVVTSEAD